MLYQNRPKNPHTEQRELISRRKGRRKGVTVVKKDLLHPLKRVEFDFKDENSTLKNFVLITKYWILKSKEEVGDTELVSKVPLFFSETYKHS